MKLPLTVFQQLLRSVSDAVQPEGLDQGRWLGHRTVWVDGSSFSMPDTPALQEHFGHPGRQLPGCGFPVAHLLALFHAGTGMVLQLLAAPLRTHDLSEVVRPHTVAQFPKWVFRLPTRQNVRPAFWHVDDHRATPPDDQY
jgi:hypothetical protein